MFNREKLRLKDEVERLHTEISYHKSVAERAVRKQGELQKAANKLVEDVVELKKMVREQTQADMLVVALKAMGAIPDPDKLDYEKEMSRYRSQLSGLQNMGMSGVSGLSNYRSGLQGLFGGIG